MDVYDEDVSHFESRFAGDKGVFAKFYIHPRPNDDKSKLEGRPMFDEVEYVEIFSPGSSTNIIRRPASQQDKERFRGAYRAFRELGESAVDGTPLSEVTWLGRSQVEELFHSRVRTVEQLAEVNDEVCTRMPGLFNLRQKAQAFLERAKGDGAAVTTLQKENEELRASLNALQETVKEQTNLLRKLTEEKAKPAKD